MRMGGGPRRAAGIEGGDSELVCCSGRNFSVIPSAYPHAHQMQQQPWPAWGDFYAVPRLPLHRGSRNEDAVRKLLVRRTGDNCTSRSSLPAITLLLFRISGRGACPLEQTPPPQVGIEIRQLSGEQTLPVSNSIAGKISAARAASCHQRV
jgi:hypothetical protein